MNYDEKAFGVASKDRCLDMRHEDLVFLRRAIAAALRSAAADAYEDAAEWDEKCSKEKRSFGFRNDGLRAKAASLRAGEGS